MIKKSTYLLCIALIFFLYTPAVFCWNELASPNGFPRLIGKPHSCAWDHDEIVFPMKGKGLLWLSNGQWIIPDMSGFPALPDSLSELPSHIYTRDRTIPWEGKYQEPYWLISHQNLPGALWCITHETGGLFVTRDFGDNWVSFAPGDLQECEYSGFAIHPVNSNMMLLIANFYPFITFDGGENWETLFAGTQNDTILSHAVAACFNPSEPYEIVLYGYFEHEEDNETTLLGEFLGVDFDGDILYNINLSPAISPYGEIFIDPAIRTNILSWSLPQYRIGVYEGESETYRFLGDVGDGENRILGFNQQNGTLYSYFYGNPETNPIIRAYPSGWEELSRIDLMFNCLDLDNSYPQGISVDNAGSLYLSLLEGMISCDNEGNDAFWVDDIPVSSGVYEILYDEQSEILYSYGTSGIFYSINSGDTWNRLVSQSAIQASLTSNGDYIYFKSLNNKLFRTNLQAEITELLLPFDENQPYDFYADIADPERIYLQKFMSNTTLYISSNMGNSWALLCDFPTAQKCLAFEPQSTGIMYSFGDALYYSQNYGFDWTELSLPEEMSHGQIIYTGLENDDECVIAGDGGVFRTDDLGESWELIPSSIDFLPQTNRNYSPKVGVFANDPIIADGFFLLETGKGLWRFDQTENQLNLVSIPEATFPSSIDTYHNNSLILAFSDGSLYVEDQYQGISNDDSYSNNLPQGVELSIKLAPNPFNQEQTFDISGISQGNITISIYTIEGRLLKQKKLNASTTSLRIPFSSILNTRDLSSGIYLIRAQSDTRVMTVKSVFIK